MNFLSLAVRCPCHTCHLAKMILAKIGTDYSNHFRLMEHMQPAMGGKSRPWFDTPCKLAALSKREAYHIWTEALNTKDLKVKTLKRKYNRASRYFKRQIAKARSKHITKIGEKLESYPSGTKFLAHSKGYDYEWRRNNAANQCHTGRDGRAQCLKLNSAKKLLGELCLLWTSISRVGRMASLL